MKSQGYLGQTAEFRKGFELTHGCIMTSETLAHMKTTKRLMGNFKQVFEPSDIYMNFLESLFESKLKELSRGVG